MSSGGVCGHLVGPSDAVAEKSQGVRIDFVLVSRGLRDRVVSCEVLDTTPPKWCAPPPAPSVSSPPMRCRPLQLNTACSACANAAAIAGLVEFELLLQAAHRAMLAAQERPRRRHHW